MTVALKFSISSILVGLAQKMQALPAAFSGAPPGDHEHLEMGWRVLKSSVLTLETILLNLLLFLAPGLLLSSTALSDRL